MPNWCENDLRIKADANTMNHIKELIGLARDEPTFDFNTLIPYPEPWASMDKECPGILRDNPGALSMDEYELKWHTRSDGYNAGGYHWCCDNWGTKWNACDVSVEEVNDSTIIIHFDTAWGPPEPIIKKLMLEFPRARMRLNYYEGGCAFKGTIASAPTRDGPPHITESSSTYRGRRGG